MPEPAEPVRLSIAADRGWLTSVGLPQTDAHLATLQALIDADTPRDRAARRAFQRIVIGTTASRRGADLAVRPIHTTVTRMRNLAAHDLDVATVIRKFPDVLDFRTATVCERMQNLRALNFDATKIVNMQPNVLNYAVESVQATVPFFSLLGLDAVRVISKLPASLGYAPESVVEKLQNFRGLGLDGSGIVNHLPVALGLATERVLLAAVLFRNANVWEQVRGSWNDRHGLDLLITPTESLALMAGLEPEKFAERPNRAAKFAKVRGWTTASERKAALRERIVPGSPGYDARFVGNLGAFAPFYLGRETGRQPLAIATVCAPGR